MNKSCYDTSIRNNKSKWEISGFALSPEEREFIEIQNLKCY